jgi:endonuclease YncB( thermonuclease family)
MKPKHALTLSIILTILIASNIYFFTQESERRKVKIGRVIDGDTLETTEGETIRLTNINTPERSQPGFQEATQFLKQFENQDVEIQTLGFDKYSRTLARIYTPNYLNLKIVELGLGKKYLVEESELSEFAEAEDQAIKNSQGLWKKSPYFSCFESTIDSEKEYVILETKCGEINLKNWVLQDESRKEYTFSRTINNKLTVFSEEGEDNEKEVYWQQKQAVWNNDRDTLYLFDSSNAIAHYDSYGY